MNRGNGAAEKWVTTFTQTLRKTLPQGQYILTHAPLAPWLAPNHQFAAGAYVTINKDVGSLIDWVRLLLRLRLRCIIAPSLTVVAPSSTVYSTTCSSTTRACTATARGC